MCINCYMFFLLSKRRKFSIQSKIYIKTNISFIIFSILVSVILFFHRYLRCYFLHV